MNITFAKGGVAVKAAKSSGATKSPSLGQAVVSAVTGQGQGFNGTQNGKKGFAPGNTYGSRRKGSVVTAASGKHRSARAVVSKHIKAGTVLSAEGRTAIKTAAAASRELQSARAAQGFAKSADAKATRAVASGRAEPLPKAGEPRPTPKPEPVATPKPTNAAAVKQGAKEASDVKTARATTHLGDLHAGAKAGALKPTDIHAHVDRIAKGTTKDELFAAAKNAGIEHSQTTKKGLVEHLKEHTHGLSKPVTAKPGDLHTIKPTAKPSDGATTAGTKAESIPPKADKFGKSNAKVQGSNFGREEKAGLPHTSAEAAARVIGNTNAIHEIPSLVGATHDAKVHVENFGNRIVASVVHPEYSAGRSIERDAKGKLVIHNDNFFVDKAHQGKGIGSEVFGRQVEQARKAGVDRIETVAARTHPTDREATNGYYTWARMGYDAKIPPTVKAKLPAELSHATRVSDLMHTPAGRDAWKEHGKTLKMRFDLHPDSVSSKVHAAYMAEREARTGAQP